MERLLLLTAILLVSAVSHAQGYGLNEWQEAAGAFKVYSGGTGEAVQTPSVFKAVSEKTVQRAKDNALRLLRDGTPGSAVDPNQNQVKVTITASAGHYAPTPQIHDPCYRYVASIVNSSLPTTTGIMCKSPSGAFDPDPAQIKK